MIRACLTLLILHCFTASGVAADACIPAEKAREHIGRTRCVTGKVQAVRQLPGGTTFLNFCENYLLCPFTVVVFRGDLRHVGDVRQLRGQVIAIEGKIQEYDGRPEIILRNARQLRGDAAKIPALPKSFDVENKGRYSAGKFSYPSERKPAKKRRQAGVQGEEPEPAAADE
jgi:hypothetical protein